ncbi:MAG: hypothetical protein AAFR64_05980 [Pseudomonadota bacterium]
MVSSFAEIAAPLALILPIAGLGSAGASMDAVQDPVEIATPEPLQLSEAPDVALPVAAPVAPGPSSFDAFKESLRWGQMTVRQRVYIRIGPRRGSMRMRRDMLARSQQQTTTQRYEEGKSNRCVPVESISNVQTGSGNRLLLFMRDAEIMSLNLEKACRAKDFYAGFYVEQSKDGKLCVNRDTLQSRNGARCEIERMAQLVAIED